MSDTFKTIVEPSTGEFKDRGSKFIAFAYSVDNQLLIKEKIEEVAKLHPKARHHCFAWRLGTDGNEYRANDDGEPSGTAGKPILGQIDSFGLSNVLIVVIRYFGGTLLGTSGLINAYREAAAEALRNAQFITKRIEKTLQLNASYTAMPTAMSLLKRTTARITAETYDDTQVIFSLSIPADDIPAFFSLFDDLDGCSVQ
jgi:uncharacterized YigZ family protein